MTKSTISVNGGAMSEVDRSRRRRSPIHFKSERGQMTKATQKPDRMNFIGGSDARIIMGKGRESAVAALAGKARRGGCPRPLRRPDRPAWPRHRGPQPPLVRAQ